MVAVALVPVNLAELDLCGLEAFLCGDFQKSYCLAEVIVDACLLIADQELVGIVAQGLEVAGCSRRLLKA